MAGSQRAKAEIHKPPCTKSESEPLLDADPRSPLGPIDNLIKLDTHPRTRGRDMSSIKQERLLTAYRHRA